MSFPLLFSQPLFGYWDSFALTPTPPGQRWFMLFMRPKVNLVTVFLQIAAKINPGASPVGQKRPLEAEMDGLGKSSDIVLLSLQHVSSI